MSAETDLRARLIAERENARTADEILHGGGRECGGGCCSCSSSAVL